MQSPKKSAGCEFCKFRYGAFYNDLEDKEIIRCYCTARHIPVRAEQMSKLCDFFQKDPNLKPKDNKSKGL